MDGNAVGEKTNPSEMCTRHYGLSCLVDPKSHKVYPWIYHILLPLTTYLPNTKTETCSGRKHPQLHTAPHSCNQHYLWQPASSNLQLQMDQHRWISQTWRFPHMRPGSGQREEPPKVSLPVTPSALTEPPRLDAKCVWVHECASQKEWGSKPNRLLLSAGGWGDRDNIISSLCNL